MSPMVVVGGAMYLGAGYLLARKVERAFWPKARATAKKVTPHVDPPHEWRLLGLAMVVAYLAFVNVTHQWIP